MSDNLPQAQGDRGQTLNKAFDPDLIERFIENQTQELAIRREENALKEKELEYSYTHAEKLLNAQLEDRERDRTHIDKNNSRGFKISVIFLLILAASISYALYLDKDEIVIELAKYIGLFLAGGVGGYSLRTIKDKNAEQKQ